jgi:hypothetical protein
MARGGARPGAGRKPGAPTKVDQELRKRALKDGNETPLEYMLRIMRDPDASHARRDDMAQAAAPYIHAKLSNIQHTGAGGGNILIEVVRYAEPVTQPAADPQAAAGSGGDASPDPPAK